MKLSQGEIIKKSMHALVKFHEYIPYSLGVMAWTRLTIWNIVKGK